MRSRQNKSSKRFSKWRYTNSRGGRKRPNNNRPKRRFNPPPVQQRRSNFRNYLQRNSIPLGVRHDPRQQFGGKRFANGQGKFFINPTKSSNTGRLQVNDNAGHPVHTASQVAAHSVNSASLGPPSSGANSQAFTNDAQLHGGVNARVHGGYTQPRQTKDAAVFNLNVESIGGPQGAPVENGIKLGASSTTTIATGIMNQCAIKLARGIYFRMRTANIIVGPPAQNDKYIPSDIPNPFTTHQSVIDVLSTLLMACIDMIKKSNRLPVPIPTHVAFALNCLANKMIVRTLQGCLDIYPGTGITWEAVNPTYDVPFTYLVQCMQLPCFGLTLTTEVPVESPISVYHNPDGTAITSTMKITEIASIVGVAIIDQASNPNLVTFYRLYDWNGLENPSSTCAFRSGFFYDMGTDPSNFPAEYYYNLVYKRNINYNHHALMQQYAQTGSVPTLEFGYSGATDINFFSTNDVAANYATSEGLNYLFDRANQPQNADKPILTTSNPQNYNNALFLAIALQTKCNNFYLNNYAGNQMANWNFDPVAEKRIDFAVAIAQFVEKIPLPSPIFEEIKNFSDLTAWTYVGRAEPVGIQWFTDIRYIDKIGGNVNNFFSGVEFNSQLMFELRHKARLNYAPELNGYMPSAHLFCIDGNSNKLFSILDAESLRNKDVMTFLNSSIIPKIYSSIPLAMTYVSVKNVNNEQNLSFLYQLAYDASTSGPSSEIDAYYRMLRNKKIGFWGALASLAGAALPYIPKLITTVVDAFHKKKPATADASTSVNSGGALLNTLIQSLTAHRADGSIALNSPQAQTVLGQPKKRILKKVGLRYKRI